MWIWGSCCCQSSGQGRKTRRRERPGHAAPIRWQTYSLGCRVLLHMYVMVWVSAALELMAYQVTIVRASRSRSEDYSDLLRPGVPKAGSVDCPHQVVGHKDHTLYDVFHVARYSTERRGAVSGNLSLGAGVCPGKGYGCGS